MSQTIDLSPFRAVLDERGVVTDRDDITPWLTDWRGRYHGDAAAILAPATTEQVAAVVGIAAQHGIPLVPQGGNTSMVGGATPPADGRALILSLRRMNRIRSIDADANLALCEAGVILANLHDAAQAANRRFPLSLGAKGSATIGGLVSTNAGGTQVLRHGTMRGLVAGLEAVLPDGSIYDGLAALKKDNRGYDIRHLLIGAEGTLGVVTAATLRLAPAMTSTLTAWVGVARPHEALHLLHRLEAQLGPVVEGFEILTEAGLKNVLAHIPDLRSPLNAPAPWHVLVEIDSSGDPDGTASALENTLAVEVANGSVLDATLAQNEAQAQAFWRIRESLSASEKALGPALQFDVSVPVARMPDFIIDTGRQVEATFPGVHASAYGHLGDGNVHFHVRAPDGTTDGSAWTSEFGKPISQFIHDAVVAAGGSISAEHGIGQMKRAELGRLSSPARLAALRAIKSALDPLGIMNPEKLIPLASEA
ncbi:FAD-binding oxidoreductase [Sphingobium subterraneum]|uniref:FAD/FMN-containing dehydrogenase n=1 Tax=Sphingobium subterraneum TaxID=627688 RepID=A0A841J5P4_9SPHN|nr:FAD-binding oxidoreductase [Sphingobium subterraneum]MBB6123541.1 FAD/FMN-containing dehydrogenase [Sphingobium subterraneum]